MRDKRTLRIVHLVVRNWIAGALLGAVFAGMLIWSDLGGMGRLLLRSDPVWPPLLLLFGGFAVTFGALVAGTAIMLIPKDDEPPDNPPGGGRMIPIRVRAR
jgi:hypothetical protein